LANWWLKAQLVQVNNTAGVRLQCPSSGSLLFGGHVSVGSCLALAIKVASFLESLLENFIAGSLFPLTLLHELLVHIWQAGGKNSNMADASFFPYVRLRGLF
jgi:hypothetical protein